MSILAYFDIHWTSVLGVLLIALSLDPLAEVLLQVNLIGGTLPFIQGLFGGFLTLGVGLLLTTTGATRVAGYIQSLILGVWG